jgi:hypothetical protein
MMQPRAQITGNVKRCNCHNVMANRRTGSNVQELGVCCPILRAHTITGLYLVEPIDMEKPFKPSLELKKYIENARQKKTSLLDKQKRAIAQLNWL